MLFWENTTHRCHSALENQESLLKDLWLIKEHTESMAGAIVNLIAGAMTDLERFNGRPKDVQWLIQRQLQRLVQGRYQDMCNC